MYYGLSPLLTVTEVLVVKLVEFFYPKFIELRRIDLWQRDPGL
jgi:hypothetical protein